MKSRMGWLTLAAAVAVLAVPTPAHAHPLGNFTVNQYAGLRITPSTVDIDYVLDLAELPTIAERAGIETAGAATQCAHIAAASTLRVDQKPVTLHSAPVTLTFPPGTAGLATLRLECHLTAPVRLHVSTELTFEFGAYTDRLGLREVTATGDGTAITRTDTSATSRTARLTSYTTDLLAKPLDMRQAAITVQPGGAPSAGAAPPSGGTKPGQDNMMLAALAGVAGKTELTLGLALLGIALALLLGAGHAVAPGHGKTIMAAYLIGQKGRRRQALAIAATVTATHTAGVLLLGLVIAASFTFAPQSLYRWLAFANGLLVAVIGLIVLRRALRRSHRAHHHHGHHHPHSWEHDHHHGHNHEHDHDHGHDDHRHEHGLAAGHITAQTRSEPDPRPVLAGGRVTAQLAVADRLMHGGHQHDHPHHDNAPSRKTVLAMGFAGGLTPSPSAVVVLLGAAAVGRAWFGVLLVLAYGVGMAATLTGVGLALARFSDHIQALIARRGGSALLHHLPAGTGVLILLIGIGIAVFALLGPAGFVQ